LNQRLKRIKKSQQGNIEKNDPTTLNNFCQFGLKIDSKMNGIN
jgi:hypothetical protein